MAATAVALPGRAAACAALLGATVAWGSTFVVTKASLDELAPATFLAWRFGIAAVAYSRWTNSTTSSRGVPAKKM